MKNCKHTGYLDDYWNPYTQSWHPAILSDAGRRLCTDCGHWLSLGPARDTAETAVEVRAAEIAGAFKGRREPFDLPLTPAEQSGCDKWPYIDPSSDELSGFLAVQIINHNGEQMNLTYTGRAAAAMLDEVR